MASFQISAFADARNNLLEAMAAGPDATMDFGRQWSALVHDFRIAHSCGLVAPEDLRVVGDAVHEIDALACCFSEVEERADSLLCDLLENASLEDGPSCPDLHLWQWLVSNLHEPYPSNECTSLLAKAVLASPQWVADWLLSARRSVGWDVLVQESFSGDQQAACSAASHVYLTSASTSLPPPKVTFELLDVKRKAEKMRDQAVSSFLSQNGCESISLFTGSDDEEDTTPPPPVAGVKRRSEESHDISPKRARAQRAFSVGNSNVPKAVCRPRRNASMPSQRSQPTSSTSCTFTLPTGQMLDVAALVAPLQASHAPSRKRSAASIDDDDAIAPVPKRHRQSVADTSASLHATHQSLDEIRAAPTGIMSPFDIDNWALNIVPSADPSFSWPPNTFDALTPPSGEVSLTVADFGDPTTFLGLDFTDHVIDGTSFSEDIWTLLSTSTSTPSSPRSVIESLSGSDTSLESLSPVTGIDVGLGRDLYVAPLDWESMSSPKPIVTAKTPAQGKVNIDASLFDLSLHNAMSQGSLSSLAFGEDLSGFSYGDWCSPQLML